MIAETEKEIIRDCAKKYNVKSVFLFGSSLEEEDGRDIDLAVEGIKPGLFFKLYADLFKRLSRPVDLVDLSAQSMFCNLIIESGLKIYG